MRAQARYFGLLLQSPGAKRDTTEARRLLRASGVPLECVWSGARLTEEFDVDHAVPYAVWGNNDLWNLLPATSKLNDAKSNKLPTRAIIRRRADVIASYWHAYRDATLQRFDTQISRALGCDLVPAGMGEPCPRWPAGNG